MDALTAITSLSRLNTGGSSLAPAMVAGESTPASGFSRVVQDILGGDVSASQEAAAAIQAVTTGEAEDLHTVSLAVAKADISFRLIMELRNRLTSAYQEVMRMQV